MAEQQLKHVVMAAMSAAILAEADRLQISLEPNTDEVNGMAAVLADRCTELLKEMFN